jgi:hypothetical protein
MRIARLAGPMIIAIMAIGLTTATTASALPEFSATSVKLSSTSGTSTLKFSGNKIVCEKDAFESEVVTKSLVGPFRVHFLNCKSSSATASGCTIKSTNTTTPGLILTNTLHGFLVLLELSTGAHRTGLLILPVGTKEFYTLASNSCTETMKAAGQIEGLVTPLKSKQTTGKVIFTEEEQAMENGREYEGVGIGKGEFKGFTLFGGTAFLETEESVVFASPIEIT